MRSKLRFQPLELDTSEDLSQSPHLANDPKTIELGTSHLRDSRQTFDFSFRLNMHDLLDSEAGLLENSSFQALYLKLSLAERQLWLREFVLFEIENFQNYRFFEPNASWKFKIRRIENLLAEKQNDGFNQVSGSYGYGTKLKGTLFYAMLSSQLNFDAEKTRSGFELGPELGFLMGPTLSSKLNVGVRYYLEPFHEDTSKDILELTARYGYQWNKRVNVRFFTGYLKLTEVNEKGCRIGSFVRFYVE